MEQSKTSPKHNLARGPNVVGKAYPWIYVLPLRVEHARRPSLELPAHASIQSKSLRGAPLVLNVKTIVGVVQSPRSLLADILRDRASLVNRRPARERGLVERRIRTGVESLEEDHEGIRTGNARRAARCVIGAEK